jgi:predicted CopG family antitoxin
MYANGHGSIDILNYLNARGIETPSQYKKPTSKASSKWNQVTILSILRNQVYIGNTVQNKVNKISYKSKKIMKIPEEKWIRVNNTHEPIIDRDLFDKVQLIIKGRDTSKITRYEYLFKGIIECYHCHRKLQIVLKSSGSKKVKSPYINCVGNKKRGSHPISMNYWKFESQVLEAIRKICKTYLNDPIFLETYNKYKFRTENIIEDYKRKSINIESKLSEINSNLDKMYFDKLNGIITEDDYVRYSNKMVDERTILIQQLIETKEKIITILNENDKNVDDEEVKKVVKEFLEMKEINKAILYRLLQKILIDKEKNIYIYFNFNSLNIINDAQRLGDVLIDFNTIKKVG